MRYSVFRIYEEVRQCSAVQCFEFDWLWCAAGSLELGLCVVMCGAVRFGLVCAVRCGLLCFGRSEVLSSDAFCYGLCGASAHLRVELDPSHRT